VGSTVDWTARGARCRNFQRKADATRFCWEGVIHILLHCEGADERIVVTCLTPAISWVAFEAAFVGRGHRQCDRKSASRTPELPHRGDGGVAVKQGKG
jgi:hypothetical protein